MSKHTPGPWRISSEKNVIVNGKVEIAFTTIYVKEAEANACLIAAAPELLEWCRDALATLQRGAELMPLDQLGQWEGVRAIIETCPIDKAEGRES